jgi:hypothetical protein
MSPEQALGREIGARSDQYSLAVMTYELLVGRPPFHGDAPAVLYQHVHEPVPRLETADGALPDPVAETVLRAMRKQPEERFATCTDFATALRAATAGGGQPVRHAPTATVTAEATPPGTRPAEPASSALASPAPAASTIDAAAETARPIWSATPRLAAGGAAALIVVTIAAMILVAVQRPKPPADAPPIGSPAVASVGAGIVLLADSFDDAAGGFLPASAPDGAPFRLGYVDGEYEIAGPRGGFVALPGTLRDSSMAVDARLVGDPVGRAIGIACRASEQGWYQVTLQPDTRSFSLAKFSFSDAATVLIPDQTSPAILRGNAVNHLELACARTTLAATANGSLLGSVEDDTYREGWFQISVLGTGNVGTDEIALRLDNLVVSQR